MRNDTYGQEMCYLFEQAINNMKIGHVEISMFLFCVIIESIAWKTSDTESKKYKEFQDWLVADSKRAKDFAAEILKEPTPSKVMCKWSDKYKKSYGAARAFARIVVETYRAIGKPPSFMKWKTETKNGVRTSTLRDPSEELDFDDLYKKLERIMRMVYHEYRSPFAHRGQKLPFSVVINTRIGFPSTPGSVKVQDLGKIALQVMKLNLRGRQPKQ